MGKVNSRLAQEATGIQNPLDFTTPVADADKVQVLIDAISNESTDPGAADARLYLDEMSPVCRTSLYVMLTALKASVT